VALAVVGVLASGGGVTLLVVRHGNTGTAERTASASPSEPLTLPPSIAGLAPQASTDDLTQTPDWQAQAKRAGGGSAVLARTYGKGGRERSVRLVAARTNLTGALDLAWAADEGTLVGDVHCTNNVVLGRGAQPRVRPTMMLCWKVSTSASVYSLIIDPTATQPVAAADGAASVKAVWQSAHPS
jgi:hypothetical protein